MTGRCDLCNEPGSTQSVTVTDTVAGAEMTFALCRRCYRTARKDPNLTVTAVVAA